MADTFAKYHCNYCEEDVNGLRVRCLECEDFDLCLQCFACGAEIGKHKREHGYQFMAGVFQDTGNFSIFPGQGHWTAREEVRLLDAIEQYGYGNWEDIARHIETRSPDEARNKYISSYIDGNIGRASWKPALERLQLPVEHANASETGPLSPTLGSSLPSQPLSSEENTILGYMPHRDDFEREWDNDAEAMIAPLFIHPVDDEDIDIALKLTQVDMYMRRLRERSRRKRVVRDFQLVPQFFKKEREKTQIPLKKKNKEDKEVIAEKLRTISQFQTASEHANLINSMVRERELRTRIRELLRYRRNGIRHVEECHEFEVARSRRDKKKENRKKGASLPQIPTQMDLSAKSKENDARSPKCLVEKKFTPLDTGGGRWLSGNLNGSGMNRSDSMLNWETGNSIQQTQQGAAAGGNDDPVPISSLPGYHLLSQRERKLCASSNIKPSQYIAYKAVLLKDEGDKQQAGVSPATRGGVCCPQGLDSHTQRLITTFMTQAGWISFT
ncbi:transcriptional adapter 2-beta-like isoform X1 [Macrobrachium nipponense]|uniref:transcriptional adapter 2-beta-like isoform X1 n=2 Tax=Macrobrachium nipponense TaxID=159736 RepID=UPI0030C8A958